MSPYSVLPGKIACPGLGQMSSPCWSALEGCWVTSLGIRGNVWDWREPHGHHKRYLLQSFSLDHLFQSRKLRARERSQRQAVTDQDLLLSCYNLPTGLSLVPRNPKCSPKVAFYWQIQHPHSNEKATGWEPERPIRSKDCGSTARIKGVCTFQHNQFVEEAEISGAQSGSGSIIHQTKPPTMILCQISPSHPSTLSQQIPLLPHHLRY